jgi:hypothetical protein
LAQYQTQLVCFQTQVPQKKKKKKKKSLCGV